MPDQRTACAATQGMSGLTIYLLCILILGSIFSYLIIEECDGRTDDGETPLFL